MGVNKDYVALLFFYLFWGYMQLLKRCQKAICKVLIFALFLTWHLPVSVQAQQFDTLSPTLLPNQGGGSSNRDAGSSFGASERKDDKSQQQMLLNPFGQDKGGMGQSGTMGTLMYQVHILGEVQRPGTYRIPASTRFAEAIQLAGGLLERGSERRIELRRPEGGTRRVDLLSFRVAGNLNSNPYLMDNDVIYVPLKDKVVQIEGAVKRPGQYELSSEKSIEDMVRFVGGFTSGLSEVAPIKVIRYHEGQKELIDVDNTPSARRSFRLEKADVIVVPHLLTDQKNFDYNISKLPGDNKLFYPSYDERVFVLGAVNRPGPYPFGIYYDVRQYLTIAGGTNKLAKLKKMKIVRADGKAEKIHDNTKVNPGDTIIVPEKYMAPESLVTLVLGITSSIIGITSAVISLTR